MKPQKFSEISKSRFLKTADVDEPTECTIERIVWERVSPPGKPAEEVAVCYFEQFDRGLILKSVNSKFLAALCGNDFDAARGLKVVLFVDPNVEYPQGNKIGGLRLRKAEERAAQRKPATQAGGGRFEDMADDIPF